MFTSECLRLLRAPERFSWKTGFKALMFRDSKGLFCFCKAIFTYWLQMPYKSNREILLIYYTFRYFQKNTLFDVYKQYYLCRTSLLLLPATT